MQLQIWIQGDGEQHEAHIVKKKRRKNYGRKASREGLLGTHRHRCKDTKINLREISCQDVNMIDLNYGCVRWYHFTCTAVNLMRRYLSTAPNSVTFMFTYVIHIKQCSTLSWHISYHLLLCFH